MTQTNNLRTHNGYHGRPANKLIDETGNTYGLWTILRRVFHERQDAHFEYRCACGFVGVMTGRNLRTGAYVGQCVKHRQPQTTGPEKFTVYALIDTRISDVYRAEMFYIGCTSQSPATRLMHHIKAARNGARDQNGRAVKVRIREVLDAGMRPALVILERTNDPARERVWIEYFLAHTMPLVNTAHHAASSAPRQPYTTARRSAAARKAYRARIARI